MKKVVIYGAGYLGEIFFYEASMFGSLEMVAFTVDQEFFHYDTFCGLPVVPFEKVKEIYPPEEYDMIVVGSARMRAKKKMFLSAKALGYNLQSHVSSRAIVEPGVKMGENTIIFSDAFIGHHSELGDNNMIRQKVYIGHQSVIGDHNIIVAGCVLGGKSVVGNLSFFGLGMIGRSKVRYGNEVLAGCGSVVVKDVEDYATVVGSPARTVSYHEDTGIDW